MSENGIIPPQITDYILTGKPINPELMGQARFFLDNVRINEFEITGYVLDRGTGRDFKGNIRTILRKESPDNINKAAVEREGIFTQGLIPLNTDIRDQQLEQQRVENMVLEFGENKNYKDALEEMYIREAGPLSLNNFEQKIDNLMFERMESDLKQHRAAYLNIYPQATPDEINRAVFARAYSYFAPTEEFDYDDPSRPRTGIDIFRDSVWEDYASQNPKEALQAELRKYNVELSDFPKEHQDVLIKAFGMGDKVIAQDAIRNIWPILQDHVETKAREARDKAFSNLNLVNILGDYIKQNFGHSLPSLSDPVSHDVLGALQEEWNRARQAGEPAPTLGTLTQIIGEYHEDIGEDLTNQLADERRKPYLEYAKKFATYDDALKHVKSWLGPTEWLDERMAEAAVGLHEYMTTAIQNNMRDGGALPNPNDYMDMFYGGANAELYANEKISNDYIKDEKRLRLEAETELGIDSYTRSETKKRMKPAVDQLMQEMANEIARNKFGTIKPLDPPDPLDELGRLGAPVGRERPGFQRTRPPGLAPVTPASAADKIMAGFGVTPEGRLAPLLGVTEAGMRYDVSKSYPAQRALIGKGFEVGIVGQQYRAAPPQPPPEHGVPGVMGRTTAFTPTRGSDLQRTFFSLFDRYEDPGFSNFVTQQIPGMMESLKAATSPFVYPVKGELTKEMYSVESPELGMEFRARGPGTTGGLGRYRAAAATKRTPTEFARERLPGLRSAYEALPSTIERRESQREVEQAEAERERRRILRTGAETVFRRRE